VFIYNWDGSLPLWLADLQFAQALTKGKKNPNHCFFPSLNLAVMFILEMVWKELSTQMQQKCKIAPVKENG